MDRLDAYFKEYNQIDEHTPYEIDQVDPKELIHPRRMDVLVKYYYIKSHETGENLDFAKELYAKHIEAFTDGTFKEHGNQDKNSLDKYFEIFDELIASFKLEGFDASRSVLPIGQHNELLDGAHRAACALYFETPVTVMKFPALSVDYGFDFFKRRLLDEFYLDFIAKEYVHLNEEIDTLVIWPKIGNAHNQKYIERELNRRGITIIYQKRLTMSREVLEDLIFTIYREEHWLGYNREKFQAVKYKADLCYDEKGSLIVYVVEGIEKGQLIELKERLRDYFAVEKSSVHTADTHEEAIEIADFLFRKDYEHVLHQNFLDRKDIDHTFGRYVQRKLRYYYRTLINWIKKIIGKPV